MWSCLGNVSANLITWEQLWLKRLRLYSVMHVFLENLHNHNRVYILHSYILFRNLSMIHGLSSVGEAQHWDLLVEQTCICIHMKCFKKDSIFTGLRSVFLCCTSNVNTLMLRSAKRVEHFSTCYTLSLSIWICCQHMTSKRYLWVSSACWFQDNFAKDRKIYVHTSNEYH